MTAHRGAASSTCGTSTRRRPTALPRCAEGAQTPGCLSVVHFLQAWNDLTGGAAAAAPGLWLISAGDFAVQEQDEATAIAQAPLWGLGRVVASEFPAFHCKLVDLGAAPSDTEVASLFDELFTPGDEDEIALRGAARYVHRYQRRPLDRPSRRVRPVGESYRLEVSRSGTIDGLTLRSLPRRAPGVGEIEIEVMAAGLNFSDVMKALGLYPGLPDGPVPLGIECSGRVVAVGPEVATFAVGDEVVAISPFSFSAFLTLPAQVVAAKPRQLTFDEAATIPIAFLTAEYALNYLGRMVEGDRVLIHSATGGVGLAAIQLRARPAPKSSRRPARRRSATCCDRSASAHVMDSRTLAFADEVTGGDRWAWR